MNNDGNNNDGRERVCIGGRFESRPCTAWRGGYPATPAASNGPRGAASEYAVSRVCSVRGASPCERTLHLDDVGNNHLRAKVLRMKVLFERCLCFRRDGVPEIRRQAEILGHTEDAMVQEFGEHAVVLRDDPFAERSDEGLDAPVPRHHDVRLLPLRNDGKRERWTRTVAGILL